MSGLTQLKVKKAAVAINTEKEDIACSKITLESESTICQHFLAQSSTTKDAVKRPSGVLLAEIDLSTSSCDESNDGDKKQQGVWRIN